MSTASPSHAPGSRRPTAAAPDTRERILQTALELFSEQGFDGTTLQAIADRLGFTKAAIYYHYRSKDDILAALVTPVIADLDRLLDAHEGMADTPAHRRRFIEDYVDYLLAHRQVMSYISQDLATVAHPALSTGGEQRRARVEAKLAGRGLDFNEQIRVAMAFRGIPRVIAQYPHADTDRLREALLDSARVLLRPRSRRAAPQKDRP